MYKIRFTQEGKSYYFAYTYNSGSVLGYRMSSHEEVMPFPTLEVARKAWSRHINTKQGITQASIVEVDTEVEELPLCHTTHE